MTLLDMDEFDRPSKADDAVKRDRWGRYLLPNPETGEEQAYTRATTITKTLDDGFAIGQWQQRMTAVGLTKRPDLLARVAAEDPESQEGKKTLNRLTEEAKEAAGSSVRSNLGTALHKFTEQLDSGAEVTAPAEQQRDVDAYRAALVRHGITVEPNWLERIVMTPSIQAAGTLDRLVRVKGRTLPLVADLKTGGFLAWLSFCQQAGIYANAEWWYDPQIGTLNPMPNVDREKALLIHLPAGEATCTPYLIDIKAGWEAVQVAMVVRKWRALKVHQLYDALEESDPGADPADAGVVEWLTARVKAIMDVGHGAAVARSWPPDVPTPRQGNYTTLQAAALDVYLGDIESEFGLPFKPDIEVTKAIGVLAAGGLLD